MNIRQLEYFVATICTGSCAQAAERVYASPQAVSKGIVKLEAELGSKLIERSGCRIAPTEFGDAVLPLAEAILQTTSEIEDLSKLAKLQVSQRETSINGPVAIRLALSSTPHRGWPVPESCLSGFRRERPDFTLVLSSYPNESCLTALQLDEADAAIVVGKSADPDIIEHRVGTVFPMAVVMASNPLARKKTLELGDLEGEHIAMPLDLRNGYAPIKAALGTRSLDASFENIAPFRQAQSDFLTKGGVILAFENTPLSNIIEGAVIRPIDFEGVADWGLYLVHYAKEALPPLVPLIHYLRNALNQNVL